MKTVKCVAVVLLALLVQNTEGRAQQNTPSSGTANASGLHTNTGNARGNAFTDDKSFITDNIKHHILEIKMAQLAEGRAGSPHVKAAGREIVQNDRAVLQKLLAMTRGGNLEGVKDSEIDSTIEAFDPGQYLTPADSAGNATSGNTVTDSLGSGSSGSGNVHGEDTGTLARTYSKKRNANYSEAGNSYIYNNTRDADEWKNMNAVKGRRFEEQWLSAMLDMQSAKLGVFNAAADKIKDEKLKVLVLQAIPQTRLHQNTLKNIQKKGGYAPAKSTGEKIGKGSGPGGNLPASERK